MKNILLILFTLSTISCTRVYLGFYDQEFFEDSNQPNELSQEVSNWEDGQRTDGSKNQFEWWYLDTKLNDGTIIVTYFYKVHFLRDQYFIGVNYTDPNGEEFSKLKYFKGNNVKFSTDSCHVEMGNNLISGNLDKYRIKIDPDDFDGFGIDFTLTSTTKPYRPQDGIIAAGENYFAWLAAVPNGVINGYATYKNKMSKVNGSGYHDHNWGNTPLQKLFKGWTWFRGVAGPYTIIVAELNMVPNRGGFDVPILFICKNDELIVNKFGNKDLYTMKSNLIKNNYRKKNEPQFSNFAIKSDDNYSVDISGKEIIDNIDIFKRMGLPYPFRVAFNISNIDPYYTRFDSEFTMKLKGGIIYKGTGIMEIMDLH